ncbi:hypothetical protein BU17DRAFT_94815 [Hysterangium stoloniferum]|nr:hypothetical protein BU17DRAFT_94815 [Hysterangium stoloniferum]
MATAEIHQGLDELPRLVSTDVLRLSSEEPGKILETRMREGFRLELRERWSCDEPGHDLCCRTVADDQHIPLSANHVEVWVDELGKGDTSYNPPTVIKMLGRPTNTTPNHREGVEEQPPLVSTGELSSDQRDQMIKTEMREIFRRKLRERWSCTKTGHDICYRAPDDDQHIALSANYVEVWADKMCQGETSYHDPPTAVKMSGRTTSNHREGGKEQLPLVPSCSRASDDEEDILDDNQHIPLSANDAEVRIDESCQGETSYHDPPTVVRMSERPTNTASDHREGVEEEPPLVSSWSRASDDEEHVPDDHQHMTLSRNDAEVRVDESFTGDTSYNDPLTVVKMAERPTNTTSNHREGAEEQLPLVSPGELISDQRGQMIKTGTREQFRGKLRERWSCTELGHDLCYRAPDDDQHIAQSVNHVEVWADELCQGETCYHDPVAVVEMSGTRTNTTSNHREVIEGDIPDDHRHMPLSANDAGVRVDEMCQGETTSHDPPTVVKMLERCTNTTANLREDVEELPPLVSSYRTSDDDQDILSANRVEGSADKFNLCQVNTSYHDPPTVVTMPGKSTNTISNLLEGVQELPPLVSLGVLSWEEIEQTIMTRMRERFRVKLRERWSCNEPGHNLCYRRHDDDQHIPLSPDHVEIWVDELCQGETSYYDPPTVVTGATSNLISYHSHGGDWGMGSHPFDSSTSIGIAGYYLGMKILYPVKKVTVMAKLTMYERTVDGSSGDKAFARFLRRHSTLTGVGRMIQQSVEFLRPSYPRQIRERARIILQDFWLHCDRMQLMNNRHTMTLKLIASLGHTFTGARWWDTNTSTAITSTLYNSLMKSPLHIRSDEVASEFIVDIAQYLADIGPGNHDPFLIGALADIVENVCHVRPLSVKELLAIRGYFEFWLNRQQGSPGHRLHRLFMHCGSQDTWLRDISGEVLNSVLRNITMDIQTPAQSTNISVTLLNDLEMLENFLDNKSLFIVHNSQLNIVGSLMVSILRHVPIFFRKYCHNQLRY